jgi:hypothetical protein
MLSSITRIALILAGYALIFAVPVAAYAGELRILDAAGLLRANKQIEQTAEVRLIVRGKHSEGLQGDLLLKNEDGLAPDIQGVMESQGRYKFSRVTAGSWSVALPSIGAKVEEVEILDN